MSVVVHRHLYCDICEEPLQGGILGADAIPDQRKFAKEHQGWVCIRVDNRIYDICGGCMSDIKGTNEARKLIREKAKRKTR